ARSSSSRVRPVQNPPVPQSEPEPPNTLERSIVGSMPVLSARVGPEPQRVVSTTYTSGGDWGFAPRRRNPRAAGQSGRFLWTSVLPPNEETHKETGPEHRNHPRHDERQPAVRSRRV